MNPIYVVVDLLNEVMPPVDEEDVIMTANKYETYKTIEGARAGAESEFSDPKDYAIFKVTIEEVK